MKRFKQFFLSLLVLFPVNILAEASDIDVISGRLYTRVADNEAMNSGFNTCPHGLFQSVKALEPQHSRLVDFVITAVKLANSRYRFKMTFYRPNEVNVTPIQISELLNNNSISLTGVLIKNERGQILDPAKRAINLKKIREISFKGKTAKGIPFNFKTDEFDAPNSNIVKDCVLNLKLSTKGYKKGFINPFGTEIDSSHRVTGGFGFACGTPKKQFLCDAPFAATVISTNLLIAE